jgi:Mn2+/Fe2+ NRAMP family transporter
MVAGASDNDPTNVGTAAVVGAQTTYQLCWVAMLVAPLLAVVQMIAAQVGMVGGGDLQSLTRRRHGPTVSFTLLLTVVVVNVVTIAADLQAGAAGLGILVGVAGQALVLPLGAALVGLLLMGRYDEVEAVLRYLLLGFFAFVAAAVLAHPGWSEVLRSSFVPRIAFSRDDVAGALALLGTTLTSYVYVWETVERGVEEPAAARPSGAGLSRARGGAVAGAVFTAAVFWFMLVVSGATLGRHHLPVSSAADAARVLRPLAGAAASKLFAAGLLISALVALPVLMATTAHVVGAQFDWRRGLSERVENAGGFYAVLAVSVLLSFSVALSGVSVLSMLVVASVIGGFGTPFGIAVLVHLARDPTVMGDRPISAPLAACGWGVGAVVAGFGLLLVVGTLTGWL